MRRKSSVEMGLTHETLFKRDIAMRYWSQLGEQEFLQVINHEIKEQIISTKTFLKVISEDPNVSGQPLAFYSNEKTVKDVCGTIEKYNNRLFDILDIMWEYAKVLDGKDSTDK